MKILFIQSTPYYKRTKLIKKSRLYFVGLAPALLAALLPSHIEFEICLETIEDINFDTDADLIAISSMGHAILRSLDIAKEFRKRGKTVIMGGYMASLMPDEALKHCDSVIIGDGEIAFLEMIEDYKKGQLQKKYYRPLEKLSYPLPKYELLTQKNIGDFLPVQAGRGCPHSCSFCSVSCLYKGKYLQREITEVLRDIRHIKKLGYKKFLLLDDNIFSDKKYLTELCNEIKKLNMQWLSQCSIKVANFPDTLKLMADSGCIALSFGIESISQKSLDSMHKAWAKVEDYPTQIKKIMQAGIDVSTEMVIGADGDTLESIMETADFITKNKIVVPRFYILTPIPGTVFYEEMLAENRIVTHDIYQFDGAHAVHIPKNMSPEELTKAYWQLYKKVFSLSSIFKRTILRRECIKSPLKYLFYLYVNLYYRKQIHKGITPNII